MPRSADPARPGLLRRLGAMGYDTLLLFGALYLATALLLPFVDDHTIPSGTPWYGAYLLGVSFLFFGWFWTHGGQTLGMRAWRIRTQRADGGALSWGQALARFAAALLSWAALGLGFLWIVIDRRNLSWHDRLSRTETVYVPRAQ